MSELDTELKRIIEEQTLKFPHGELLSAAKGISEKYRIHAGKQERFAVSPAEIAAYALVRMPATFAAVSRAFDCVCEYFDEEITTILDAGAGTGAAGWAAAERFPDALGLVCLEREKAMLDFGSLLMEKAAFPFPATWSRSDIAKESTDEKADLVTASYVLGELRQSDIAGTVSKLWESTQKLLLIVEPGTMRGFETIRLARDLLIKKGAFVCAPCPHAGKCPIFDGDWCHFTARTGRTKLHKLLKGGNSPFEDEKFSFVAVTRAPCRHCQCRVLRHPVVESGRISLTLCQNNAISHRTVTKKDPAFSSARKLRCADSFQL